MYISYINMERILISICFALFFVIIFLLQKVEWTNHESMIPGFWSVTDEFKEKAKIDQMMIYFSEGEGYLYPGFFLLQYDGETEYNGTMNFRITPKGYFKSKEFTFETEKCLKVMPKKLTMTLDLDTGLMELKCNTSGKSYARLYKDNAMSATTVLKIFKENIDPEDGVDTSDSDSDDEFDNEDSESTGGTDGAK
jgi:hypothetical protein